MELTNTQEHNSVELSLNPVESDPSAKKQKSLCKIEVFKILILIYMYILQGIPVGLATGIPLILASKKANYSRLSIYSFALWPNSMKILWAPLIDSVYFTKFGRRKTWIAPSLLVIGIFMVIFSKFTQNVIDNDHKTAHNTGLSFFS